MIQKLKQAIAEKSLKKIRIPAVIAIVLACSLTFMVVASAISASRVTIHDGTVTTAVTTLKSDPAAILAQADLVLGKDDFLDTSAFVEGEDSQLTVYRACGIIITQDGQTTDMIACKTVGFTLEKNSIALSPDDYISVALDEPVFEGMTVRLDRAFGVTITADGKTLPLQIAPGTVTDALQKAKITLDKDDETQPAAEKPLSPGMKIKVLRVEYAQRTVQEKVPYERKTKMTDSLYSGQSKLAQEGVNGEKTVVYKDRFVNGALAKTAVVSEKVTKEPVDKIVMIGTKHRITKITFKSGLSPISDLKPPAGLKLDANGLPLHYKKIIDGTAKAYSGGGTTATGRPAMPGHIAVNPKQIPYGTKLYVVSLDGRYIYGYCIAADTGGFVRKNSCTVDLYMDTEYQCNQFGHRGVRIYVLD